MFAINLRRPAGLMDKAFASLSERFWVRVPGRAELRLASVAQSAERKPFKLVVVGSSPTVGSMMFTAHTIKPCHRNFAWQRVPIAWLYFIGVKKINR